VPFVKRFFPIWLKALTDLIGICGTVENGLSAVFITLGEPQDHGDTAKAVPFVESPLSHLA
jgi:hypothetical protein